MIREVGGLRSIRNASQSLRLAMNSGSIIPSMNLYSGVKCLLYVKNMRPLNPMQFNGLHLENITSLCLILTTAHLNFLVSLSHPHGLFCFCTGLVFILIFNYFILIFIDERVHFSCNFPASSFPVVVYSIGDNRQTLHQVLASL